MTYDAAVIGGGITGLTLAYLLQKAGRSVALFEPGRLGGVIQSVQTEGFTPETGPNVLLAKPALEQLAAELSLTGALVSPVIDRYKQFVWHDNHLVRVPRGPHLIVGTPLLPFKSKLLLLRNLLAGHALITKKESTFLDDKSVADFFQPLLGREGVHHLLDPVLKGIFGGDAERLSARTIFPELWSAARGGRSLFQYLQQKKRSSGKRQLYVLKGGIAALTGALTERLDGSAVIHRHKVVDLRISSDGFEVVTQGDISTKPAYARSVFITTSGADTAQFLASTNSELANRLSALRFASLAVVHIDAKEPTPVPADSFGVLFPKGTWALEANTSRSEMAPVPLLGIMFNSRLFPHLAPPRHQLLTVCLGGPESRPMLEHSDEELAEAAQSAVNRFLGVQKGRVLNVARWSAAIPQFEVGHHRLVEWMRRCEGEIPGLHFAGSDTGGVSVPDRIQCAFDLAAACVTESY